MERITRGLDIEGMIKKAILFTCIVFCFELYAQASWSYTFLFKLYDKNGQKIEPKDFKSKQVRLLAPKFGRHTTKGFTYDKHKEVYTFS